MLWDNTTGLNLTSNNPLSSCSLCLSSDRTRQKQLKSHEGMRRAWKAVRHGYMEHVFWENAKTPWETFSHFLTFPFSNISQRLRVHFSRISIVQITFRKMLKLWSATEHAGTSFQRKSTAHLTALKWLQEKHNPLKRLATPQLTLHHFARSASSFTKNNCSWDV